MSYTLEDFYITPEIELCNMMIISDKRLMMAQIWVQKHLIGLQI